VTGSETDALATVTVAVARGVEPGSLRIRQEGTGNVLLRFEALIAAAGQLLETAMTATAAKPEAVTPDLVTETLAAYIAGKLDESAETMVSVALDALSPGRPAPAAEYDDPDDE
jgi:hypothetical protein